MQIISRDFDLTAKESKATEQEILESTNAGTLSTEQFFQPTVHSVV